jgi:hypothetical protein
VRICCGIGPEEKPPFWMAYSTSSALSARWLKFGPSLYSRVATFVADPSVPATSIV